MTPVPEAEHTEADADPPSGTLPRGVVAAMLTPFEPSGAIAHDLYLKHARSLLAEGCAGVVPFGTTGEAASVGIEERMDALERLVAGGVPAARLVPGTGTTALADTARLTRHAVDLGCAAVLVLPPFYYPSVSDDGLFAYYRDLIARVDRPSLRIVLYHIPQVAGVGLSLGLVRRLKAAFPDAVVGIKDSSGDRANLQVLLEIENLAVYPGSELLLPEALSAGGPGCITATANANAAAIARLVALRESADAPRFRDAFEAVRRVRLAVQEAGAIPGQKALMALRTGDARWRAVRPPLLPADAGVAAALDRALGRA